MTTSFIPRLMIVCWMFLMWSTAAALSAKTMPSDVHSPLEFEAYESSVQLPCGSDKRILYQEPPKNITGYTKINHVWTIAVQLADFLASDLVKLTMVNNRRRSFADLKCRGDICWIALDSRRAMLVQADFTMDYCSSRGRARTKFEFVFHQPILEPIRLNGSRQYNFRCKKDSCDKDRLVSDMEYHLDPSYHGEAIGLIASKGLIYLNNLQPNENYTLNVRYRSQDQRHWSPWSFNPFETASEDLIVLGYDSHGNTYVKYDHWIKKSLQNATIALTKRGELVNYDKDSPDVTSIPCIRLLHDDEKFVITWGESAKGWPQAAVLRVVWSEASAWLSGNTGVLLSNYTDIGLTDGKNYFLKEAHANLNLTIGYGLITAPDSAPVMIHRLSSGTYFPESLSIFQIFDVRLTNVEHNAARVNWKIRYAKDPAKEQIFNWIINLHSPAADMQIPITTRQVFEPYALRNLTGCTAYSGTIQLGRLRSCPFVFTTATPDFLLTSLHAQVEDREIYLTWSLLGDCVYEDAYFQLFFNDKLITNHINYDSRSYRVGGLLRNMIYNIDLFACHQGKCNVRQLQARTTVSDLDNLTIDYVTINGSTSLLCSISEPVDFFVFIVEDSSGGGTLLQRRTQETCEFEGDCGFTPRNITISLQVGVRLGNGTTMLSQPMPIYVGEVQICWTRISAFVITLAVFSTALLVWLHKDIRKLLNWRRRQHSGTIILPEALDILGDSTPTQRMLRIDDNYPALRLT